MSGYRVNQDLRINSGLQPEAIQNNRDLGAKIIFAYANLSVPMCLK